MKCNLSTKFLALAMLSAGVVFLSHGTTNIATLRGTSDEKIRMLLTLDILSIFVALIVPLFAVRSIFQPQREMIEAMHRIAQGQSDVVIPHTSRRDEMGEMARALAVFKENAQHIVDMAGEKERQHDLAEARKHKAIQDLATTFETNVQHVVDTVASAATQMDSTAKSVATTTSANQQRLNSLATQIAGATQNVQTVSGSVTQLSTAIGEINEQVSRATSITSVAVAEAQKADATVEGLTDAARKIGEVVEMINAIAGQINLLALNATIEAARAGDAGKGFAVVAAEVKNLATQTTKATEQIAQYIGSIQTATSETVGVIKNIGATINEMNEISTIISVAVSAQGETTRYISNNVQQAADSTEEVSRNASEVSSSSEQTGESAKQMILATSELSQQSELLRKEVGKFLSGIRNG